MAARIDSRWIFLKKIHKKTPLLGGWERGKISVAFEGGGAKAAERVTSFVESYTFEHYRTMSSRLQIGRLARLMLSKGNPGLEQQ